MSLLEEFFPSETEAERHEKLQKEGSEAESLNN